MINTITSEALIVFTSKQICGKVGPFWKLIMASSDQLEVDQEKSIVTPVNFN